MPKRKTNNFLFYPVAALFIFCFAFGLHLTYKNLSAPGIFVSARQARQGDTVFIRVKTKEPHVEGMFDGEKISFTKRNGEWVGFLGIDAAHKPGNYKILAKDSGGRKMEGQIKILEADFSKENPAPAPSQKQTGIFQQTAINNIVKKDNPVLGNVLQVKNDKPYFWSSFSFPLVKMEESGMPFGKYVKFLDYKIQHLGTDLRAPKGTDIFAVNDGKVVFEGSLSNYGKTIIIDHGLDIFSLYLHLYDFKVSEGEMVRRGQRIGLAGDTGYATAAHLHFSMRVDGSRVNPVNFIKVSKEMDGNFMLADIMSATKSLFGF